MVRRLLGAADCAAVGHGYRAGARALADLLAARPDLDRVRRPAGSGERRPGHPHPPRLPRDRVTASAARHLPTLAHERSPASSCSSASATPTTSAPSSATRPRSARADSCSTPPVPIRLPQGHPHLDGAVVARALRAARSRGRTCWRRCSSAAGMWWASRPRTGQEPLWEAAAAARHRAHRAGLRPRRRRPDARGPAAPVRVLARIPMAAGVDSLNVAVSVGVALYELSRTPYAETES